MIEVPALAFVWMVVASAFVMVQAVGFVVVHAWGGVITSKTRRKKRIERRAARRLRRRQKRTPPNAVQELLEVKTRIRQEDHQRWSNDFESAAGHHWSRPSNPPASANTMEAVHVDRRHGVLYRDLGSTIIRNADGQVVAEFNDSWDGKHHATCPYECDCPDWARLPS